MSEPSISAGWYKRPSNPSQERYWDGTAWAGQIRDAQATERAESSVPAGWYTDPRDADEERYWDGTTWTNQTRINDLPPPGAPANQPVVSAVAEAPEATLQGGKRPLSAERLWITALSLLVIVVIIIVAASGGGGKKGSGTSGTYTHFTFNNSSSGCGETSLSVGERTHATVNITNTSGHAWAQTWIWIGGLKNLGVAGVSMNGQPSLLAGGSQGEFSLGPLAAGATGNIHVELVAKGVAQELTIFQAWGSASSTIPEFAPEVPSESEELVGHCTYNIG